MYKIKQFKKVYNEKSHSYNLSPQFSIPTPPGWGGVWNFFFLSFQCFVQIQMHKKIYSYPPPHNTLFFFF